MLKKSKQKKTERQGYKKKVKRKRQKDKDIKKVNRKRQKGKDIKQRGACRQTDKPPAAGQSGIYCTCMLQMNVKPISILLGVINQPMLRQHFWVRLFFHYFKHLLCLYFCIDFDYSFCISVCVFNFAVSPCLSPYLCICPLDHLPFPLAVCFECLSPLPSIRTILTSSLSSFSLTTYLSVPFFFFFFFF